MNTKPRDELRQSLDNTLEARKLKLASAEPMNHVGQNPQPNCFPVEAPRGAIMVRNSLFLGEVASSTIIMSGMILHGSWTWILLAPFIVLAFEYWVIPLMKTPGLIDARIYELKAFVAKDRHAQAAFEHESKRWRKLDVLIFFAVLLLFLLKAGLLVSYGSTFGMVVFLGNWLVALAGVGIHLNGLVSRVACHYRAKRLDEGERQKRLHEDAHKLMRTGEDVLGTLVEAVFPFECSETLVTGKVDGHSLESDGEGGYVLRCRGILDDGDRDSYLRHQKTLPAQQQLGRALVTIQLEMLSLNNLKAMQQTDSPAQAERSPDQQIAAA
ncbi:MAG: hypothetical protein NTV80_12165 [Verrucomicrobia bacterium]|nr:hypothetical protein [Verrucomicrobiota bacterium]